MHRRNIFIGLGALLLSGLLALAPAPAAQAATQAAQAVSQSVGQAAAHPQVAAGYFHSCALLANGSVQCWGDDFHGQLGNGAPLTDSATPVTVSGITTATAIAAGERHTCALLANGTVQCWGSDDNGQLGNGAPNSDSPAPVAVTGLSAATIAIAAGGAHTCALLATGTAQCWGSDDNGQLGTSGPNANSPTPVSVTGISTATAIAAGGSHTCAVLANGPLRCWGDDFFGQLGNDASLTDSPTPDNVSGIATATAIAAGYAHTCALLATGSVQCWGRDDVGQLGNGNPPTNSPTPVTVSSITTATAIAVGGNHTCARLANGTVQCWGSDAEGQLGNGGSDTDSPTPVPVTGISTATAISTGGIHTCAVLANGMVQCWGDDFSGQLGNGLPLTDSPTPITTLAQQPFGVTAIAAGYRHTCALLGNGTVQCWGNDESGRLGNGNPLTDSPTPVTVSGITTATAIATGLDHTCALLANGTVQCWGNDLFGQLGDGFPAEDSPTPVTVSGITTATAIAVGGYHTCALLANGTVQCWGSDAEGQLGDDVALTNSLVPVPVTGVTIATAISTGGIHTCAVLVNGTVQCWGRDDFGQLGNNVAFSDNPTPVAVSGLSALPLSIAAGGNHTCARLVAGTVQCWGLDQSGQLGNGGTFSNSGTPVTVSSLTSAAAIATGFSHTCALLADGSTQCWGADSAGQLGDGTVGTPNNNPAPVAVTGITTATAIAAGGSHTCARLATGTMQCWGEDGFGQLGDAVVANPTNDPTPSAVYFFRVNLPLLRR